MLTWVEDGREGRDLWDERGNAAGVNEFREEWKSGSGLDGHAWVELDLIIY
jgi:hypothetical protein